MKRSEFLAILASPLMAPVLKLVPKPDPPPYKNFAIFIPEPKIMAACDAVELSNRIHVIRSFYEVRSEGTHRVFEFEHGQD